MHVNQKCYLLLNFYFVPKSISDHRLSRRGKHHDGFTSGCLDTAERHDSLAETKEVFAVLLTVERGCF